MTPTLTAEEAAVKIAELQRLFDMRWDADQRAIKMWQAAAPEGEDRSLIWPDHADLVVWLLERLAEARACLEPFAKFPTTEAMEDDEIVGIGFRYLGDNDSLVSGPGFLITAGHLRAAAALHEKLGKMG